MISNLSRFIERHSLNWIFEDEIDPSSTLIQDLQIGQPGGYAVGHEVADCTIHLNLDQSLIRSGIVVVGD